MNPLLAVGLALLVGEVPAPEESRPTWISAVVVGGLVVATLLLWLSLRKQLRKIHFEEHDPDEPPGTEER